MPSAISDIHMEEGTFAEEGEGAYQCVTGFKRGVDDEIRSFRIRGGMLHDRRTDGCI